MSYTKERWEAFCDVCESSTPHPDSEPIVRIGFDDYVRARACVNACAGIPTEHLERCNAIGAVDEIIAERNELKKQRDELLAAQDENMDRQYRAGFMSGWNAGVAGDEKTKLSVANRIASAKGGA